MIILIMKKNKINSNNQTYYFPFLTKLNVIVLNPNVLNDIVNVLQKTLIALVNVNALYN